MIVFHRGGLLVIDESHRVPLLMNEKKAKEKRDRDEKKVWML